jgi:hypothetical protein
MFWTKTYLLIKNTGKNVANDTRPTGGKITDLNHIGHFMWAKKLNEKSVNYN